MQVIKIYKQAEYKSLEGYIARVFGYLQRTINLGLFYSDFPAVMKGYCDVSWITSSSDNKSTSGWIFSLERDIISWATKKQTCISHFIMKSEFITMAVAGKEAEWLRNMLLDIKLWSQPMSAISLYYDSETTMCRVYNNIYNGKSRHISIQYGYIRELVTNEVIIIVYVKYVNNLADPLKKRLSRDMVWKTTNGMWLIPVIKDNGNRNPTSDHQEVYL